MMHDFKITASFKHNKADTHEFTVTAKADNNAGEDVEKREALLLLVRLQIDPPTLKINVEKILKKLTQLLDLCPKDPAACSTDACSDIFCPPLFIVARKWKQPK